MELGFDLEVALKELTTQEPDREGTVRVFVGTVFSLTPSGKFYMPWASSNVAGCPGCHGTGHVRMPVRPRVAKKWVARNRDARRLWIKRYGYASAREWPEHIQQRSDRLNRLLHRMDNTCGVCDGLGSAEAAKDERWQAFVEKTLAPHGCWMESGEGNGTDLYLCRQQEKLTEEVTDGAA